MEELRISILTLISIITKKTTINIIESIIPIVDTLQLDFISETFLIFEIVGGRPTIEYIFRLLFIYGDMKDCASLLRINTYTYNLLKKYYIIKKNTWSKISNFISFEETYQRFFNFFKNTMYLSGGFLTHLIHKTSYADIDIYIDVKNIKTKYFNHLDKKCDWITKELNKLEFFCDENNYNFEILRVYNNKDKNKNPFQFQFILFNFNFSNETSIIEIVKNFDFSILKSFCKISTNIVFSLYPRIKNKKYSQISSKQKDTKIKNEITGNRLIKYIERGVIFIGKEYTRYINELKDSICLINKIIKLLPFHIIFNEEIIFSINIFGHIRFNFLKIDENLYSACKSIYNETDKQLKIIFNVSKTDDETLFISKIHSIIFMENFVITFEEVEKIGLKIKL